MITNLEQQPMHTKNPNAYMKTGTNTNSAFSITSPKRMVNNAQQPTQTTNGLGCWGHHCLGSKNWQ
jgi:hypothetical protein